MARRVDERVEAAAVALWADTSSAPWEILDATVRDRYRLKARIVLRAFRDAQKVKAEREGRTSSYLERHVQHLLLEALG